MDTTSTAAPEAKTTRLQRTLRRYRWGVRTIAQGRVQRYPMTFAQLAAARLKHGVGPVLFAVYRLQRKPMSTWGDYFKDTVDNEQYDGVNPPSRRRPLDDKLFFHSHCVRHGAATAPILGVVPGPDAMELFGLPAITDPRHFASLFAAHPQGLFCKRFDGSHGAGAFRILHADGGCLLPTGPASVEQAFAYATACAREKKALIVQPRLINATALRPLMAGGAFGTARVMTVLDGDEPKLFAAVLRIIAGGNIADNFNQGTSGNLVAPIDGATGRVTAVRTSRSTDWPDIVDIDTHPAVGLVLPFWTDVLGLCFRAHRAFAGLRIIGWDVGITDDGPLLVEGNATPDLDLMQIALDRGLKPEFARIAAQGPTALPV